MTTLGELQQLLHVEESHTSNFEKWERRATHPLAKLVFRMAADKEANHIRWVKLLIDIAQADGMEQDWGVTQSDLEFWVADEAGEADLYRKRAASVEEPWVKAALQQMGEDEKTNSELLKSVLEARRAKV